MHGSLYIFVFDSCTGCSFVRSSCYMFGMVVMSCYDCCPCVLGVVIFVIYYC